MVLGKGQQLAGCKLWGYLELPWDGTRDSPSVLAGPWTRQSKAQACRSEFLKLFFFIIAPLRSPLDIFFLNHIF